MMVENPREILYEVLDSATSYCWHRPTLAGARASDQRANIESWTATFTDFQATSLMMCLQLFRCTDRKFRILRVDALSNRPWTNLHLPSLL
jgi:hypothetical protein